MQFSVGPCLRARVSPTGHFLELLPPAVPFLPAAEGDAPCPRARVTFGRSPKSDQKCCLKPQVSRLPARLGCAENRGRVPRENQDSADRRTTNRVRSSCRCRSCVPCGGALVYRRGDYRIAHLPPPTSVGAGRRGAGGKITRGVKRFRCTERTGKFPLWDVGAAAGMGGIRGYASGGSVSSGSGRGCSVPSGTGHFWPQPQK